MKIAKLKSVAKKLGDRHFLYNGWVWTHHAGEAYARRICSYLMWMGKR